ncbi:MAG TPA: M14 family metallopeptidase [Planctomycetota bacterium]|jgi:hypothetical protein|nr:M14 family metallopeptidase [Planctomycetota bacterium]
MKLTPRLSWFLCACATFTSARAPAQSVLDGRRPRIDLCEVRVRDDAERERLFRAARDPDDHFPVTDGKARIYSDPLEEARLVRMGFDLTVVQPDLSSYYATRAAADAKSLTQGGSMGGFKTLAEIGAEMDRLAATYPTIVSPKFSIGTSVEGRAIWAMRISDNPAIDEPGEAIAVFDALHHAREPMGGEALLLFADEVCSNYPADPVARRLVDTRDLLFVPCVNPDGYEYNRQTNPGGGGMWRKNRRNNGGTFGVDLNRNYSWEWGPQWAGSSGVPGDETYRGPSAFSEPETRAIRDFLLAHPAGMSLSAHTYGNLWLYPWGYDSVPTPDDLLFQRYGQLATAANAWVYGPPPLVLYIANGVSVDWHYGQVGVFAFSPEIGSSSDGFWPLPSQIQPLYQAVRPGLFQVAKWSGGWAERGPVAWSEFIGDGDAFIEPGETWNLTIGITNPGVDAVSGNLHISSANPNITVLSADAGFGVGAQVFAATPAGGHPIRTAHPLGLQIAVAPNAPLGSYHLDLAIIWDGLSSIDAVPVDVGEPRLLATDDMEIVDFGWQVTTTGANYAFQRAVPQQTMNGGAIAQPGNDDPAGSGTMCWVTGAAAGGSAGANDVDGITTLTSPIFRASGFGHLELDYARWYADMLGSVVDDQLLVEVSNDAGAHWTTLETSQNANVWTTRTFALESVLPLTDAMKIRFTAADSPSNSLCEALVDDVALKTFSSLPTLGEWGTTSATAGTRLFVDGPDSVSYTVKMSTSVGAGTTTPGTAGLLYLTGSITDVATGTTDGAGRAALPWTVPSGTRVYLQVLLDQGGPQAAWSNLLTVVIQ